MIQCDTSVKNVKKIHDDSFGLNSYLCPVNWKLDPFVGALLGAIGLAYALPQLGVGEQGQWLDTLGSLGVSLIFFFYGLKLSPDKIVEGLRNWKLHLLVQGATFLLFPIVVLAAFPFVSSETQHRLFLAFFFLAALPSTVSSSVVMVSLARGNVPAAIFNASISGLIGMGLTPLWMGLFLSTTNPDFVLTDVYRQLLIEILLPVVLGLLMHRRWGAYAVRYAKVLIRFDKSVIWLIVFKSFAASFHQGLFAEISVFNLLGILAGVASLFFLVFSTIGWLSTRFGFPVEDRITAQYCGTKKSLVHGTVFANILFAGQPMGMVLLPLMFFHAFQLLVVSMLAQRASQREDTEAC